MAAQASLPPPLAPGQSTQERWALDPMRKSAWAWNRQVNKSEPRALGKTVGAGGSRSDTNLKVRSEVSHKSALVECAASNVSLQNAVDVARKCVDMAAWQAKSLLHVDALERRRAVRLATCLGVFVSPFFEKLILLLEDDDSEVCEWALTALNRLDAAAAADALSILLQVKSLDRMVFLRAVSILKRRAGTEEASQSVSSPQRPYFKLPSLVGSSSKRASSRTLQEQEKAEALSANATRLLRYGSRMQKLATLQNLRHLDYAALPEPPWYLADICVELVRADLNQAVTADDGLVTVSMEAAMTMAAIGEAALHHIASCLGDADSEVRRAAIRGLKFVGPAAAGSSPLIAACFKDPVSQVRGEAAKALLAFGPTVVKQYKMAIDSTSSDADSNVRKAARHTLERGLKPRETWRTLGGEERDPTEDDKQKRMSILARMTRGQQGLL